MEFKLIKDVNEKESYKAMKAMGKRYSVKVPKEDWAQAMAEFEAHFIKLRENLQHEVEIGIISHAEVTKTFKTESTVIGELAFFFSNALKAGAKVEFFDGDILINGKKLKLNYYEEKLPTLGDEELQSLDQLKEKMEFKLIKEFNEKESYKAMKAMGRRYSVKVSKEDWAQAMAEFEAHFIKLGQNLQHTAEISIISHAEVTKTFKTESSVIGEVAFFLSQAFKTGAKVEFFDGDILINGEKLKLNYYEEKLPTLGDEELQTLDQIKENIEIDNRNDNELEKL